MQKAAFLIILGVLAVAGIIYLFFDKAPFREPEGSEEIKIIQQWDLPAVLEEISGIAFLGEDRIAAIQDEKGVIFIYNLRSSSIEKEIPFGGTGDYEGVTVDGSTAYVLRSDGIIYEVKNFESVSTKIIQHTPDYDENYDFEGIVYDPPNRRLLLAMKDKAGDEFKPVFGYDLNTLKLQREPAYKIDFSHKVFKILKRKQSHKMMRPSDLAIHPVTGDIYILEGQNPKLLILNSSGDIKELHVFKPSQFSQAEGITFNEEGEIYISNEGSGDPANILKVKLNSSK